MKVETKYPRSPTLGSERSDLNMSREGGMMMSFGLELVYSTFVRTVIDNLLGIGTAYFSST